ncbi:MAG: molybdopterin oxidoreductase family protein, partial [Acidimicrobiales bacterium]
AFLPALRRGNGHGALDMGLAPGVLPGRTDLDAGRDWYTAAWGSVPATRGLDATGTLTAAAAGHIDVLVLVGADPLCDFPDRSLARRALARVGTVVAVDCFLTASAAAATVVLPAATFAERGGTTTNLEGRVTRLAAKITAPGLARPDWMIAAELAARLGADFGWPDLDAVWAEITRLSPAHAGLTPAVLAAHRDGVVVPMAGAVDQARPPLLTFAGAPDDPAAPPVDAYSLRMVSSRVLYDNATWTQHSPALAPLARPAQLRANPYDLARLGVTTGDRVRLRSPHHTTVVEVAADGTVPRGSAWFPFNPPGEGAADLIDCTRPVIDVRIETL